MGNQGVLFTGRRACQLRPQVDNPQSGQTTRCGRAAAVISPLCSGVKVPVCLDSVLAVDPIGGYFNWMWTQNVFPVQRPLLSHFPRQCAHFRQFLKARRGQTTGNWCKTGTIGAKKVTTNWWQKGAKGHRAKEGLLGGTLVVGQVRWRIPLPAARCSLSGSPRISARAVVPPGNRPQSVTFKQPFVPNPSAAARGSPLIPLPSPPPLSLSSLPTTDHFLIPPELFMG